MPPDADLSTIMERHDLQVWLFEALETIRREQQEQHQRLRADISAGAASLRDDVRQNLSRLDIISADVLVLKTTRDIEERQVVRRSTWIALVAGALMSAFWDTLKMWVARRS